MGHFRVSVRHHLRRKGVQHNIKTAGDKWKIKGGQNEIQYLVCSTHLILSENFNTCAESHKRLIDVAWGETNEQYITYETQGLVFWEKTTRAFKGDS